MSSCGQAMSTWRWRQNLHTATGRLMRPHAASCGLMRQSSSRPMPRYHSLSQQGHFRQGSVVSCTGGAAPPCTGTVVTRAISVAQRPLGMLLARRTAHFGRCSRRLSVVAMAKPWRPHIDDVDRLSRGDGAKVRGTGSRDIPHRLNEQENAGFRTAKKKGFVVVRGTGYRRERKGNPLPNIFRQWCDAKEMPCVVIEQDMLGGPLDCVVVDLTTMRLPDTTKVRQVCLDLAASMGLRPMQPEERSVLDVPFNVLPLTLPGSSSSGNDSGMGPSSESGKVFPKTTNPRNVQKPLAHGERQHTELEALGGSVSNASLLAIRGSGAAQAAEEGATAGSRLPGLESRVLEMQQRLDAQRDLVRQLKEEQGRGNADEEVQRQVQHLMQLKADAAAAQEDVDSAIGDIDIRKRQSASARRAAIFEAFTDEGGSGGPDASAHNNEGDAQDVAGTLLGDTGALEVPVSAASTSAAAPDHQGHDREILVLNSDGLAGGEVSTDSPEGVSPAGTALAISGGVTSGGFADAQHPFCRAAIWQLAAEPLFFEADRATAKAFARDVLVRLGCQQAAGARA